MGDLFYSMSHSRSEFRELWHARCLFQLILSEKQKILSVCHFLHLCLKTLDSENSGGKKTGKERVVCARVCVCMHMRACERARERAQVGGNSCVWPAASPRPKSVKCQIYLSVSLVKPRQFLFPFKLVCYFDSSSLRHLIILTFPYLKI